MRSLDRIRGVLILVVGILAMPTAGCFGSRSAYMRPQPPAPLGSLSDPLWQRQESNAEASDFVVHQHEFKLNEVRLNSAGQDHLKQIAGRWRTGQEFPVVVERSDTSRKEGTRFGYPVHTNPDLDMRRRQLVVRSLEALGVDDADERVVVAHAYAPGLQAGEAEGGYQRGLGSGGYFGSDYGGFGMFNGLGGVFGGGGFGGVRGRGGFGFGRGAVSTPRPSGGTTAP